MTEPDVFILAEQALENVVGKIKADQWQLKLPQWFKLGQTQDREKLTLKGLINYHAYDTAWVPDVLSGKTIAEVGDKYDGDLLGDDPIQAYEKLSIAAQAFANSFKLEDLDNIAHLSYGDFPMREYLKHITSFRVFRSYDIAKLIGVDTQLDSQLVQAFWDQLLPDVDQWRAMGVFGPEVKVPDNADLQTKLLALSGRSIE